MDDASIQLIVDGSLREYRIQNSATTITLEVAAASRLGVGPASAPVHLNSGRHANEETVHRRSRRSICDPRTDFWCRGDNFSTDRGAEERGGLYTASIIMCALQLFS
uniref:Uncharacterized protein n=1 Tax=Panagrolaimus davidi TaxID=227884 RepID=A0A914PSR9_9BILA